MAFRTLAPEYRARWTRARVKPVREADCVRQASRILANRPRYLAVSDATGVSW
jgi:lysozyme family protein